jgi:hypothetical protein
MSVPVYSHDSGQVFAPQKTNVISSSFSIYQVDLQILQFIPSHFSGISDLHHRAMSVPVYSHHVLQVESHVKKFISVFITPVNSHNLHTVPDDQHFSGLSGPPQPATNSPESVHQTGQF